MSGKNVTTAILKTLTPLDGLKAENLQALVKKTTIQELSSGRFLFKEGDQEKRTIYVLSGEVELRTDTKVVRVVSGGGNDAKHPLAPMLPRKVNARARTNIEFISIDSDLLDVMLTWDQTGSYEVNELRGSEESESDDWMTTLLQAKAFHKIPPANIQAIFMNMQRVSFKSGDTVIKQGDEGDFFYVITDGRCAVTRETPLNKDGIKLAELKSGDTFGEEALISEAKRNATVSMLTDGALMRLAKDHFNKLLNEPMLDWVNYDEALNIIKDGGKWLDVRLPSEFSNFHKDGAINIPLYFIRLKLKTLDTNVKYVVCCDTGRRSSAGAYILSERGFDTYVLEGGLTMSDAGLG
ncbi:MAG: cyclic nucleotide-binding domain-containing protein [Gammaproteobacteria bacterium]